MNHFFTPKLKQVFISTRAICLLSNNFKSPKPTLNQLPTLYFSKSFNSTNGYLAMKRFSTQVTVNPISVPKSEPKEMKHNKMKKKKGIRTVSETHQDTQILVEKKDITMKSSQSFCTSEEYDFVKLLPLLEKNFTMMPHLTDDVFHVKLIDPCKNQLKASGNDNDAFIFNDGTVVVWGSSPSQTNRLLQILKQVEINPNKIEADVFDYYYDDSVTAHITPDAMVIGDTSLISFNQQKLALSSGLSRSIKLSVLENLLENHLERNKHIPQQLLNGQKLNITQRKVLSKVGEIFILRGKLNLHSELLDAPDFCWSSSKMEELYHRISKNLDVGARISVFNKKLDYANEVVEMMRCHLHSEHSVRLEIIIIVLISIEIVFECVHFAERLGYIRYD